MLKVHPRKLTNRTEISPLGHTKPAILTILVLLMDLWMFASRYFPVPVAGWLMRNFGHIQARRGLSSKLRPAIPQSLNVRHPHRRYGPMPITVKHFQVHCNTEA